MFLRFLWSLLFATGSWALFRAARRWDDRRQALRSLPTVPVRQLIDDAASVAQELGPGSFRQEVRLRGRVSCDRPLVADLSHTVCVSFRFSVTREYEEVLWEKDPEGKSWGRRVRRSEEVAGNEASVPFWIDDGTGRLTVLPDRARIERAKTHSSFRAADEASPTDTLGYRSEEECLAVGTEVTIVAEAGDLGGVLALRHPEGGTTPYWVSEHPAEALGRSNLPWGPVLRGGASGLALVAVLILLLGVIR